MRRPGPELDCCVTEKNNYTSHCNILSSSVMAKEGPETCSRLIRDKQGFFFFPENSDIGGVLISVVE